ncbi:MAG TPA: type 4a pilus biogenesis protein PilO [Geobacteraceae bacterium]|nr:type 4a pilus biogenesis protein PilO [Geobacteraceae bacterium]
MNLDNVRQILIVRRKIFIAIAILILVDAVLYIYCSAYLEPRLGLLQLKWSEKRLETARSTSLDNATVYRQGIADLAAWRARIYPKKDFARFIGELFETASNSSLKVGAITYKPDMVKDEGLLAYSIGFNVSGKYAAIKSFIADLERLREIVVIDNISLTGKGTEESVDMKLQLTAYFRVEG